MTDVDSTTSEEMTSPGLETAATTPARPRIRGAGIVWGLVFAALAVAGIAASTRPGALERLARWTREVEAATVIGYGVLAVGALVLIVGLVGLVRRAQAAVGERRR